MWYAGEEPGKSFGIGYATSPDGMNWTKHQGNPVMKGESGFAVSHVQPSTIVKRDSLYMMWFNERHSDNLWCIGYAESEDGINWSKYENNPVLDIGRSGNFDS
jgi:hypothetical protein